MAEVAQNDHILFVNLCGIRDGNKKEGDTSWIWNVSCYKQMCYKEIGFAVSAIYFFEVGFPIFKLQKILR